jgi:hypothetical protein
MPITDLTSPMELLGSHPGINVIDPATVLTRLWYFDGKFLRADGFRLDQEYVRSLVALSNQATGHGVVHGFDVDLLGGDELRVEGGLALAPSGRVVYLPRNADLSISRLIERSTHLFDAGFPSTKDRSRFGLCPPDAASGPDLPIASTLIYVLTASSTEALCGEEERFGQLCEDACATETDRSVAVEGVSFRVHEIRLPLKTSKAVSFIGRHERSRVASAYFERERALVASMISHAGLRSPVWCDGAEGVAGEEVALAVFNRSGHVTSWLDMWTARRELMETSPQRYWGWRFAMRPLDAFLAQVLQFQCQLLELGHDDQPGTDDPCARERDALVAAGAVLQAVTMERLPLAARAERLVTANDAALALDDAPGAPAFLSKLFGAETIQQIDAVRRTIAQTLAGAITPASGSLLIDRGIGELPAAGYLPTNPERDVKAQVRALMGPGVDLQFCAVRPDFIPEAFQEAQHMERISLTQGIDDTGALEDVDILVPDGEVVEADPETSDTFAGAISLLPRRLSRAGEAAVSGSAMKLSAVAREHTGPSWSWTLAAYGEAPQQVSVPKVATAVLTEMRTRSDAAPDAQPVDVVVRPDRDLDAIRIAPEFRLRASREATFAAERLERVRPMAFTAETPATRVRVEPDRRLEPDRGRPMALWLDVDVDADLMALDVGGQAAARVRASTYSRSRTSPVLMDVKITGRLTVTNREQRGDVMAITTRLEGIEDRMTVVGDNTDDPSPEQVDTELLWELSTTPVGARVLRVALRRASSGIQLGFTDAGSPRQITGALDFVIVGDSVIATGDWQPASVAVSADARRTRVADLELRESPGALDVGAPDRDLAETAIQVIATELALPGRDATFGETARARMFPPPARKAHEIRARADWVMFHRRRTKVCGLEPVEQPVRFRRYRWHHAVVQRGDDLKRFEAMRTTFARRDDASEHLVSRVREPVDGLGFVPVATLEFPEQHADLHSPLAALRAAFNGSARGDALVASAIGDIGTNDGESIALARLATVRGAVSDLISTANANTSYLPDLPPEFVATGIDGAIFTVGMARPQHEVELACAQIYKVSKEMFAFLMRQLDRMDAPSDEWLAAMHRELGREVDVFTAKFEDLEWVNGDDVVGWWAGPTPAEVFAGLRRDVVENDDLVERWRQRLDALAQFFGPQRLDGPPWDIRECQGLLIALHPGID